MSKISPLAYIDPEARIGNNCEIGPFCFIDKNVVIGDNNILMNNVSILYGTRLGNDNTIFPGAVIGAIPQDLKFQGEETTAEIGNNNTIRENVTINRGTIAKGKTSVGSNNLLMENAHVAHDVMLGNGCIVGNSTKIAGEVTIDDFAVISAGVLMHQFCHIGSYVMIGGGTRFAQDIPPFVMAAREPVAYCGLNIVGLRRRGFSKEIIENIHNTYRILYQRGKLREECLAQIREEVPMSKEIEYILSFIENSQRGIIK
jgi:UDP-N-acetylglucosamine acyltransferase